MELLVVLAVATILTSLLLPAMSSLRENVNRVVCSSGLRQVGLGMVMYVDDHKDMLPGTIQLEDPDGRWKPHELMSVHHGQSPDGWDGLGLLYEEGYCAAPQCFYCPSHRGDHPMEKYIDRWRKPRNAPIYTNYHYAGHRYWQSGRHRIWRNVDQLVIASDGLRTASDFNHGNGMNMLFGDASVRWSSAAQSILPLLPSSVNETYDLGDEYNSIWHNIQGPNDTPFSD